MTSRAALESALAERLGSVSEARWMAEEVLGRRRAGESPVGADAARALSAMATRRLSGEPLQYVLGTWAFRTLELGVDERALIPRPETEQVVDVALAELRRAGRGSAAPGPIAADLGTGSGAIALALAAWADHRRMKLVEWLAALATFGVAYWMPSVTHTGSMVRAWLAAYRRTLQATLRQAQSMTEVVDKRVLPWIETPDQARRLRQLGCPLGQGFLWSRPLTAAAAERLFAAHGIDGVSLRQIAVEGGSANNSAVHYYFKSKHGLIAAIFRHRLPQLVSERRLLVARCDPTDLRSRLEARMRRLRAGNVGINPSGRNPGTPFGGFKMSGVGRDGARFGMEAYSELQSIVWPA